MSDSTALELVKTANSLPDLLTALAPARRQESTALVAKTAKKVELTEKVKNALESIASVGSGVNVTERRPLTESEQTALMAERQILDVIEKYIKDRKEAHKTMGYNHLDCQAEAAGDDDGDRDKDGFLVKAGRIEVPSLGKAFSREVRGGSPVLRPEALEANLDRKDYLAMTTEVRVLDEAKVMLHLRRHPDLAPKIAEVIEKDPSTTAWSVRPL